MKRIRIWSLSGLAGLCLLYVVSDRFAYQKSIPRLTINDLCYSLTAAPDADAKIPRSLAELDGRTVEIIGDRVDYQTDAFLLTDSSHFHSYMPRPPLAQEFVHVKMNLGSVAAPVSGKLLVCGTLHVKIERNELGEILSIYRLDADWVKPFPFSPQNSSDPTLFYAGMSAVAIIIVLFTPFLWHFLRRQRWTKQGCCQRCGYNLRATPCRCPVCGTVSKNFEEFHAFVG
jgi:hypothetical protein